jgi:SAM-dependent methyltransferase
MEHEFDQDYWDKHWQQAHGSHALGHAVPPNPHLVREISGLAPGTALEAGCGEGAEAIWLGLEGWKVTAVDIAAGALERAGEHAAGRGTDRIRWVQADLSTWQPPAAYDLVTTHYAHPSIPQLEFYDRLGTWVAPGGTLLIVGHRHHAHSDHGHDQPPAEASATAASITERLDSSTWAIITADELTRIMESPGGGEVTLQDVVVRARRRA